MSYFDRVIKKADRGYIVYNDISSGYGLESMSVQEFVGLLKEQGIRPRTHKEFFAGAGNVLVIWDRTR
jgi:hypothetical protein